jgi:hypothetical protein
LHCNYSWLAKILYVLHCNYIALAYFLYILPTE